MMRSRHRPWLITAVLLFAAGRIDASPAASSRIRVVASVPNLGLIAAAIGGDRIDLHVIAVGAQDARFVDPRLSFATTLHDSDLLFINGLDLEARWIQKLVQGARNPKILLGRPGYIDCSLAIQPVEIPAYVNHSFGEVHPYGEPFYLTDPLNAVPVAATIARALERADPGSAELYEEGRRLFVRRLHEAFFGKSLTDLVDEAKLVDASSVRSLDTFLDATSVNGVSLRSRVGGWLGKMQAIKGKPIVTYHRDYSYFANRFGLRVVDSVEANPGIQPSNKHLRELAERLQHGETGVIVTRPFLEHRSTDLLAQQTGFKVITLPLEVGGAPEASDYLKLFDFVIDRIVAAFDATG